MTTRDGLLVEMQERMYRNESAEVILEWLDGIGYFDDVGIRTVEENEPSYAEASVLAVSTSMANFYNDLVNQGVPTEAATAIAIAFMTNATKGK